MSGSPEEHRSADFRRDARALREAAERRATPEQREGAEPADTDAPEYSRGHPLDDPQPSSRHGEELESEADRENKADVRSDQRDI